MSEESVEVRLRWRDCFKIAAAQFLFNLFVVLIMLAFLSAALPRYY